MNTQMFGFSSDAQGHFQKAMQAAASGVTGKHGRVRPSGLSQSLSLCAPSASEAPFTQAPPDAQGLVSPSEQLGGRTQ